MRGAGELAEGAGPTPGRERRPGAGRPRAEDAQPGLGAALAGLLEEATRGDPVVEVKWTTLSLRDLEREMAARGFRVGKDALGRMLRAAGYSLQGMSRTIEGRQHPDRDAQFRHVNAMIAQFAAAGDPVVSVDGKKKEQLGPFHRAGRSWRPAGNRSGSPATTSPTRSWAGSPRSGSTTSPRTGASCPSGPAMTPPRSPSPRSAAGGWPRGSPATRARPGSW